MDDTEDSALYPSLVISDRHWEDKVCSEAEYERLLEVITKLKPKYREALYYRFVVGLSVNEMAELLNSEKSTIQKQIGRGKALLLQLLEQEKEEIGK